jgi:uncharacterized DUF497 family protein
VGFQWDPRKAAANRRKHGVSFADVVGVFFDEQALTIADETKGEQRFLTVGFDVLGRLVVVAYAWQGEDIRIISARRATTREQRSHERKR